MFDYRLFQKSTIFFDNLYSNYQNKKNIYYLLI